MVTNTSESFPDAPPNSASAVVVALPGLQAEDFIGLLINDSDYPVGLSGPWVTGVTVGSFVAVINNLTGATISPAIVGLRILWVSDS